jgi:hypothetical protein
VLSNATRANNAAELVAAIRQQLKEGAEHAAGDPDHFNFGRFIAH